MKNPRDSEPDSALFDDQVYHYHTVRAWKEALRQDQLPVADLRFFDDQNLLDFSLTRALI